MPTDDGYEKPKAITISQADPAGEKLTVDEVVKSMENNVVRYKRIINGTEFVETTPNNSLARVKRGN